MRAEMNAQGLPGMPENNFLARRSAYLVAIIFFANTLSGCGPFLTLYANLTKECQEPDNSAEQCRKPTNDAFSEQLAKKFGIMALFAHVVYRIDLVQKAKGVSGCSYLESDIADDYGMPRSEAGQWQRWRPKPSDQSSNDSNFTG